MFGMEKLMGGMYGGEQPPAQAPSKPAKAQQPQKATVTEATTPVVATNRGPHQSMTDMMHIVEDMYNGGQNNALIQTNTAPAADASRRTRSGSENDQQNTGGDGEQVKQAFKAWLQQFDQAVQALDGSDKTKGDAMWKDVVDCVDQCWKAYTEQGQLS